MACLTIGPIMYSTLRGYAKMARVKLDVALIPIRDPAGYLVGITAIMREA